MHFLNYFGLLHAKSNKIAKKKTTKRIWISSPIVFGSFIPSLVGSNSHLSDYSLLSQNNYQPGTPKATMRFLQEAWNQSTTSYLYAE